MFRSEPNITAIFFLMKTLTIYGIKNCDTMKKTFSWFDNNGISYQFHDYKKLGIDEKTLKSWLSKTDLDILVNKKGTTFKKLNSDEQIACHKIDGAIPLLLEKSSMIKRPLIAFNKKIYIGYEPETWETIFLK